MLWGVCTGGTAKGEAATDVLGIGPGTPRVCGALTVPSGPLLPDRTVSSG